MPICLSILLICCTLCGQALLQCVLEVESVAPVFCRFLEVVEFGDVCLPIVFIEVLLASARPDEETSKAM